MHTTPAKIVLPSIGPLFATGQRTLQPLHSLPQISTPTLRTPTNNHVMLSFDSTFAMSSPVRKEANKTTNFNMLNNAATLESFKLDRPFPSSSGPTSPTDVDDFASVEDDTVQDGGEKMRLSRERNRLHAQRTRIRKRELLENLKGSISGLQNEYKLLKHAYESHVTAVCLLSLGGKGVSPFIQGLDEMMDIVADHVMSVKDDDVLSGHTALSLHDKNCQYYHMDVDEEISSCSCLVGRPTGESTGTTSSTTSLMMCSKEEREQGRRERNRLHARRARLRKKLMLEKNQKTAMILRARNENLRVRLRMLVATIYESRLVVHPPMA